MDEEKYEKILAEIEARKQLLRNTDYEAIKASEGAISEEDYHALKVQRQTWRDEINEYEKELGE